MAIATIKDNLVTNLGQVSGVTKVFSDMPGKAPERSECPAIIVRFRDPSCTVSPKSGMTLYRWHLDIVFCLYPIGVETMPHKEQDIETFPALVVAKLNANASLQAAAKSIVFDRTFKIGFFQVLNVDFYGFVLQQDIDEYVAETYAA
mgnify:FL=1